MPKHRKSSTSSSRKSESKVDELWQRLEREINELPQSKRCVMVKNLDIYLVIGDTDSIYFSNHNFAKL